MKHWIIWFLLTISILEATPKVTVVGAGLAGLTAAYRLQKMGIPVEVYEARNRPGGRVFTAYFGSSYEELGGKNLNDGGDALHILALIEEMGLEVESHSGGQAPRVLLNDRMLSLQSLCRDAPAATEEAYASLSHKKDQVKSLGELVDDFIGNRPDLRCLMEMWMHGYEGIPSHAMAPQLFDAVFWKLYMSVMRSAQTFDEGKVPTHTFRTVVGGNSCLVGKLATALDGHIHYRHALKKVSRNGNGFQIRFDGAEPVEAEYLILALPCATLREVEFERDLLPEDQLTAIRTLSYGTHGKILLPVKFKPGTPTIGFVDSIATWCNRDQSIMTLYLYDPTDIFDSDSVLATTRLLQSRIASLCRYYEDLQFTYGLVPTVPRDEFKPQFKQPVGISWAHEPFSRGSYSTYGVGQYDFFNTFVEDKGVTVRKVFRPVLNHLFFAGEHAALDVYATMEGAVESGESAARLVKTYLSEFLP